MNNADKPIYNTGHTDEELEGLNGHFNLGLSKREHFAGMAMQGIISNQPFLENMKDNIKGDLDGLVAIASVEMADALLKALHGGES